MDLSCLQEERSSFISATFEVSNLERSRSVKDWQPLNMPLMFVTCEVAKLERSRVVKDEQSKNIFLIFVT